MFSFQFFFKDFKIKKKLVKNAIEIYNNIRPHLSNEMLTPIQMHAQKKIRPKQIFFIIWK